MNLAKASISQIPAKPGLVMPESNAFELPEKVLQFGTGVLLRALPDFIINRANNKGLFNGRIVMVKSTSGAGSDGFAKQDGLYSVVVRGNDKDKVISETHIVAAVSRVLSASSEWDKILECASNPHLQVIISNTTEVGIILVKDNVHADPPKSFPGKLLSFLYHRFRFFKGDPDKGMVIVPTELIPANGDTLLAIVLELAHINGLESSFLDWLENANHFCNSLVDRIVPGKLNEKEMNEIENAFGFRDEGMIMSEAYAFWAIQSDNTRVKQVLSFANGRDCVIAPDIHKFRELKLRLLNSPHTFSCGLAVLAGFDTVKKAMNDSTFSAYIKRLLFDEIIPAIVSTNISREEATVFANHVIDRYRNNFIEHSWMNISLQVSTKMYLRNVALIQKYYECFGQPPAHMALGMAAHILFMKVDPLTSKGEWKGIGYVVTDDHIEHYNKAWKQTPQLAVKVILGDKDLWKTDLNSLPGFYDSVIYWLDCIINKGAMAALQESNMKIPVAHEK